MSLEGTDFNDVFRFDSEDPGIEPLMEQNFIGVIGGDGDDTFEVRGGRTPHGMWGGAGADSFIVGDIPIPGSSFTGSGTMMVFDPDPQDSVSDTLARVATGGGTLVQNENDDNKYQYRDGPNRIFYIYYVVTGILVVDFKEPDVYASPWNDLGTIAPFDFHNGDAGITLSGIPTGGGGNGGGGGKPPKSSSATATSDPMTDPSATQLVQSMATFDADEGALNLGATSTAPDDNTTTLASQYDGDHGAFG